MSDITTIELYFKAFRVRGSAFQKGCKKKLIKIYFDSY